MSNESTCTIRTVRYFITDPLTGESREVDKFPEPTPTDAEKQAGFILALQAAAEYEREQCCMDICDMCDEGYEVTRREEGCWFQWFHDPLGFCHAQDIRERAWGESKWKESETD